MYIQANQPETIESFICPSEFFDSFLQVFKVLEMYNFGYGKKGKKELAVMSVP